MTMVNYFVENLWQFWAIVAVVCLIVELSTGGFFVLCFALGAVVTAIVSIFDLSFYGQLFVFAVCSLLAVFLVRPFALKYFRNHKSPDRVSNADALMDRVGVVSTAIEANGFGRVAIDGDDWKAVSDDGGAVAQGARVKVVGRDSIILTVHAL
jgi:membrane protein implicated in regulation of membrane protease activity